MILVDLQNKNSEVAASKKIIQCLSCSNSFFNAGGTNTNFPQKEKKVI